MYLIQNIQIVNRVLVPLQLNINIIVQERGTFDPLLRGPSIRPYTTVQLDTGAHLSQKFKFNVSKFYDNFLGGRLFVP